MRQKKSFSSEDMVEPGTIMFTPRYFIKPSGKSLAGNNAFSDEGLITGLCAGLESQGSTLSADPYLSSVVSSLPADERPPEYTDADLDKLASEYGFEPNSYSWNQKPICDPEWITITNVSTSEPYEMDGSTLGYDRIKAEKYYLGVTWSITGKVKVNEYDIYGNISGSHDEVVTKGDKWERWENTSELGQNLEFCIRDDDRYCGVNPPSPEVITCCGYDIAAVKVDKNGNLEELVEPGKSDSIQGFDLSVTGDGSVVIADMSLKKDIYISSADGTTAPAGDDYKKPLDDFYYSPDANSLDPNAAYVYDGDENTFCVSGSAFPAMLGERPITLKELFEGQCPDLVRNEITPSITIHLNEKNRRRCLGRNFSQYLFRCSYCIRSRG